MNHSRLPIDYLFIDEAHKLISTDGRSAYYYKVIDFLAKRKLIGMPKIIFSSPNIRNPQLFQETIKDSTIQFTSKAFKQSPVNQFKFAIDFYNKKIAIYNTIENKLLLSQTYNVNTSLNTLLQSQSGLLESDTNKMKNTIVYCS